MQHPDKRGVKLSGLKTEEASEVATMWKTPNRLTQQWQRNWGLLAGVATAAAFLSVQWLTPHVGDSCNPLAQVEEEWRVGRPATPVICIPPLYADPVNRPPPKPPPTPAQTRPT